MAMKRKNGGLEDHLAAKAAEVSTLSEEQEKKHKQVLEQALSGLAGSAGKPGMKAVYKIDANGNPLKDAEGHEIVLRWIKIKEPRKAIPVYVPESLYAEFDRITSGRGVSKNAEINRMVREYVADADK